MTMKDGCMYISLPSIESFETTSIRPSIKNKMTKAQISKLLFQ